jgi:hypothetical protein
MSSIPDCVADNSDGTDRGILVLDLWRQAFAIWRQIDPPQVNTPTTISAATNTRHVVAI